MIPKSKMRKVYLIMIIQNIVSIMKMTKMINIIKIQIKKLIMIMKKDHPFLMEKIIILIILIIMINSIFQKI